MKKEEVKQTLAQAMIIVNNTSCHTYIPMYTNTIRYTGMRNKQNVKGSLKMSMHAIFHEHSKW